ncbi:MAG TPA: carotenoid oxygenase family protein [Solirubrobacteraceae bacterium]|jgi:carotenoid cleavage dioxygenase-like enzyme
MPAPVDVSDLTASVGFDSLEHETVVEDLPVRGEPPVWLSGSLLRTGPAKFEVGSQGMRHWFDGLAMLHRFTVDGGRVSYGNRFLRSRSYEAAREQGRIAYGEFASDPCRSLFKRVQSLFSEPSLSDNANVNVARLGERFLAMTETPLPVQFDARTLESAAIHPYRAPGQLSTAHPHLDRSSGGLVNYAAKLGPRSEYRFFMLEPDATKPRVIASVPVREPAYMHSFGLTEHWLVLVEFPLVVNPLSLALAGRPYIENYRWKPERGTRFTLVERSSGRVAARIEGEACFSFHHVNAFEQDDEVVVDLCAYPDAGIVQDLYLDRLRAGKPVAGARLTRFRLAPGGGSLRRETIGDCDIELPRIDYSRRNEREYRYVWGASVGDGDFIADVVKLDTHDGGHLRWSEPGCFAGEPVFVRRPEGSGEDDGVLLSVVLDAGSERSFLLVLDAADLGELARAEVPHGIPFGFHGQFERGLA